MYYECVWRVGSALTAMSEPYLLLQVKADVCYFLLNKECIAVFFIYVFIFNGHFKATTMSGCIMCFQLFPIVCWPLNKLDMSIIMFPKYQSLTSACFIFRYLSMSNLDLYNVVLQHLHKTEFC